MAATTILQIFPQKIWEKAIVGQGLKGRWNYHLAPVYTICLMDFVAEEGKARIPKS
jgi:hypothetical protein